jgi:hypothetical protein
MPLPMASLLDIATTQPGGKKWALSFIWKWKMESTYN